MVIGHALLPVEQLARRQHHCRDGAGQLRRSPWTILANGGQFQTAGVLLPLLSRRVKALRPSSFPFTAARCFGGGVVLATGFIHVFPEGMELLGNECLSWPDYPVRLFCQQPDCSKCVSVMKWTLHAVAELPLRSVAKECGIWCAATCIHLAECSGAR